MADKKSESKPQASTTEEAPKRGLPIKTIGIVAGLMIAEAAGVYFLLGATSPATSDAQVTHGLHDDESEKTAEVLIVEDKFQNLQTGKVWLWDAAIYVQVKQKNVERVEKELERRNAEIKEQVSQIFSRAQHAQLKEPDRQTLNRQLNNYLQDLFSSKSDEHPVIERLIIARCRGFPAE
ncbi:MAG: hypothetical protein KF745_02250 [Phycisphaeraceae bacterium]|nr:hypothetical protein [Phycisphaeraceae bacterium]